MWTSCVLSVAWRGRSGFWVTVGELFFSAVLFVNLFYAPYACSTQLVIVVSFTVLLLLLNGGEGCLSKILNRRPFGALGRYGYSIYMVQPLVLLLMDLMGVSQMDLVLNHVRISALIAVFLVVLSGVGLYYLVERLGMSFFGTRKGGA